MVMGIINNSHCHNSSFSRLVSIGNKNNDSLKWYNRLSHIGQDRMKNLVREGLSNTLIKIDLPTSEYCLMGKLTRKLFSKAYKPNFPLQLIHSNIFGPLNVRLMHGNSYFIAFMDIYTHCNHVYLIFHNSEALGKIYKSKANLALKIKNKKIKFQINMKKQQ